MEASYARAVWRVLEPVHVVTYFAPECLEANKAVGLRGFWMGYFGSRAAPMGPVPPGVVEATFYNFHPSRVRRAIPDAWSFAAPEAIIEARTTAAAQALRRLAPSVDRAAEAVNEVLAAVVEAADGAARPLFGANRDLAAPQDPVGALWQAATALREHRGDGHVDVLAAEGLDGCEVHVLVSRTRDIPYEMYRDSRGWSEQEWAAATDRLARRGILDDDGRALSERIEHRTNELAVRPYQQVENAGRVAAQLAEVATEITGSGVIPFPNPIGLRTR